MDFKPIAMENYKGQAIFLWDKQANQLTFKVNLTLSAATALFLM